MSKQILVSKILHCLNAMVSNFDRIKLILIVFQQQLDTIPFTKLVYNFCRH
ncbi:protein of unknown function [[Clostridium] ultunense Esp]|uniref:Uncharacterized protein n=1 Tax=[Clostridium] ultunense Esp TaxID=1288971 RepID=A0A1M4PM37_9FIRM|nr:protein of unknown function [[Clostridium] ultunense Esp]